MAVIKATVGYSCGFLPLVSVPPSSASPLTSCMLLAVCKEALNSPGSGPWLSALLRCLALAELHTHKKVNKANLLMKYVSLFAL